MKHELKRVAILVLTLSILSGALGVVTTVGLRLFDAQGRGDLTLLSALVTLGQGWRLFLDIAAISAVLSLVFLRAVPLPRAALWIAAGMIAGSMVGAALSFSSEVRAWIVAYMLGGAVIGLVATSVRLWGAERASRGRPVRVGTLLAK